MLWVTVDWHMEKIMGEGPGKLGNLQKLVESGETGDVAPGVSTLGMQESKVTLQVSLVEVCIPAGTVAAMHLDKDFSSITKPPFSPCLSHSRML